MTRFSTLALASTLAVASLTANTQAAGIIRDPGVGTAGHAALSVGTGIFSYSSTSTSPGYYGAANPFVGGSSTYYPNGGVSGSSGDAVLSLDTPANPTSSSLYSPNYLTAARWYIGGNGGLRNTLAAQAPSTVTDNQASYTGNFATNTYSGMGTSTWRANATTTVLLTDGATPGSGQAIYTITVQRKSFGGSTDTSAIPFSLAFLADVDAAGTSTGDIISDISSGLDKRIKFTDGANYAELLGVNAAQAATGGRLTTGTNALVTSSNLLGAGNFANAAVTTNTDSAGAFRWAATLQPEGSVDINGNPTDRATLQFVVAYNQLAVVPEPTSLAALGLAAGLLGRRRRA